ncbi:MAG: hypothetical protein AAGF12_38265, partial [Myxococcota bacterium]
YPELRSVDDWDFREVTRISRRINRFIRSRALNKRGSRPVLPDAAERDAAGELTLALNPF